MREKNGKGGGKHEKEGKGKGREEEEVKAELMVGKQWQRRGREAEGKARVLAGSAG